MPSTGLRGSFPLTADGIRRNVTKSSPGAYALGRLRAEDSIFLVSRVGRSDKDVANRLGDYIGDYDRFKYEYYPSAKAALEKECRLDHDFDPPDNESPPDRPDNDGWGCPVCPVFD